MNKYTGLKLSKLLADNGFKGESNLVRLNGEEEIRHKRQDNLYNPVPVYDILNDLCVKYAKEIFGEWIDDDTDWHYGWEHNTQIIFSLLQQNKKDEAEEYIWEHCLFNLLIINNMKDLIKKQEERFWNTFYKGGKEDYEKCEKILDFICEVRKETAEAERERIKEKVEEWRRGFSMTCAESTIYEKAHQQILKVLKDI